MRSFPDSAMRDGRRWWEEVTVCPIFCTCYEVCLSNSCWWVWISILVRRLLHVAWKIRSSYSPTWAFSLVRVASVCSWNSHNWHASQMPEYPVWMHCFHEKLLHWACQTSLIHLASISLEHKTIFFLAKLWHEFFEISWNEACLHFKKETKQNSNGYLMTSFSSYFSVLSEFGRWQSYSVEHNEFTYSLLLYSRGSFLLPSWPLFYDQCADSFLL